MIYLERAEYLPNDVSDIVKKLIHIRRNTFLNAAARSPDDYQEGSGHKFEWTKVRIGK